MNLSRYFFKIVENFLADGIGFYCLSVQIFWGKYVFPRKENLGKIFEKTFDITHREVSCFTKTSICYNILKIKYVMGGG